MKNSKEQYLNSAKLIADWICAVQFKVSDRTAESGRFLWMVNPDDANENAGANNWNMAFAIMGLLKASKQFNKPRYEEAALDMGRYLKTLQIFSPFLPEHYGAIRELTPQTPWCYTRDALSAAWSFIELYRYTRCPEYLERARLWGEWFLKNGMDEYGWPLWGVQFEPYFKASQPQMCNNMHGSFQGGNLNFFYHLYKETGNKKWIGDFFVNIADILVDKIQQPDGFFRTVAAATGKVPETDPQNGLHRGNDDLACLGLLCAYEVTRDKRYLDAIDKFLKAVFDRQDDQGFFEQSCAAIPVVLTILNEANGKISYKADSQKMEKALQALLSRQIINEKTPLLDGGFDELGNGIVCARSTCYALLYLLDK